MTEISSEQQLEKPLRNGAERRSLGEPGAAGQKGAAAVQAMLDDKAKALTRKLIERALAGDGTALRLCIERIHPVRRDGAVSFDMPKIESPSDAAKLMGALLAGVADGAIAPCEAGEIARVVETYVKTLEVSQYERRIAHLEERASHASW
jgi:hypothetical protein